MLVSGSGRGSNLQAILDGCEAGTIDGRVAVVVGTKADAPALQRAERAEVPVVVVSPRCFTTEEAYGAELLHQFERFRVDLVCLAGYMRILPAAVVRAYRNRVMNIHPALLPAFGGKGMYGHYVHEAVLESGAKYSGCTVHFVDEQYDTGPIIVQRVVPVHDDDNAELLASRILEQEHQAYVEAIKLFSEDRLRVDGRRVRVIPDPVAGN